jgi:hypothetical protein
MLLQIDPIGRAIGWMARTDLSLLFLGLMVLLLCVNELGYRIGQMALGRRVRATAEGAPPAERDSVGFVTAGMLGLAAFLLGVSLSMGQSRFDTRRDMVRDEANAIGTVWLRADLLGPGQTQPFRAKLREYTELRLEEVRNPPVPRDASGVSGRAAALQSELWRMGVAAAAATPDPIRATMILGLNDMIDFSLSSRRALIDRVPVGVLHMLLWATIISVGMVGYNFGVAGHRQLAVTGLLLVFWSAGLVLIVDLNDPRLGFPTDPAPLVWTLQGFGPAPAR